MHVLVTLAALTLSTSAMAAPIVWETSTDTTGPLSVLDAGETISAHNLTPHTQNDVVVNGVRFESNLLLFGQRFPNQPLAGFSTGDAEMDLLLGGFDHGSSGSGTVNIGDGMLQVGETYVVQVFMTDLRRLTSVTRGQTFGDGLGNTVYVDAQGSDPGVSSFGRNALGVFVADGTEQTLTIAPEGVSSNAHITAYQIRRVPPRSIVVTDTVLAGTTASLLAVDYTPGEMVGFVWSDRRGAFELPPCPGVSVGIRAPRFIGSAVADSNGSARLDFDVAGNLVGDRIHIQSGVLSSCTVGPRRDVDVD